MINWKDIPGYEGFYQASECGQIRSLSRFSNAKNNSKKFFEGKVLVPTKKSGYLRLNLSVDGIAVRFSVHRLIAKTFLSNTENHNSINHKDGNKLNNHYTNLEWCSVAHNNLHAYRVCGKVNPMQGRKGKFNPNSKPVFCLTTSERFDSATEAAEKYNVFATTIAKICKGKGYKVNGLKFKYA